VIDAAGLEFIGIQDHPYNATFLDTWTLIATLTQATQRIRFFPNVANLPLRPPAMLAKAAASLDVLSGGRIELGLGAGAIWEGITAMGGPSRSPGAAVEALEEAIQIIRTFWSDARTVQFAGKHYQVRGARPGPRPAHSMSIWLGAYGPRMLALTGRRADGWVPSLGYAPPERLPEMQQRIDAAAREAGRKPQDIRRVYNVMGQITEGPAQRLLVGPVSHWIEELTRFAVELGMDTFIFWPPEDRMHQIERFAAEVVPGVRAAVARARGSA
jgi:alkanesulfonate monooxygenase SsuD/methylene tetrahydromethanopterin reductase-like flavin-dependent oxidoreductase (luciferase family)